MKSQGKSFPIINPCFIEVTLYKFRTIVDTETALALEDKKAVMAIHTIFYSFLR